MSRQFQFVYLMRISSIYKNKKIRYHWKLVITYFVYSHFSVIFFLLFYYYCFSMFGWKQQRIFPVLWIRYSKKLNNYSNAELVLPRPRERRTASRTNIVIHRYSHVFARRLLWIPSCPRIPGYRFFDRVCLI